MELFDGIASSRSTGLSTLGWDARGMWSQPGPMFQKSASGNANEWIARSADLQTRSSEFDSSAASLHRIVSAHHGYFEDLRTESRSGFGRSLSAAVAVPSEEFEATLFELEALGRIGAVSESGEDSAVKLAAAARRLSAAQRNLLRLQKLQRERKGELRDAVALEKDIAQAADSVAEGERLQETLHNTIAQAHIGFVLTEDYRAPFQVSLTGDFLEIRNSFAEGISTIFSTLALVCSVVFSYGVPVVFWLALLFGPLRACYRRLRKRTATVPHAA